MYEIVQNDTLVIWFKNGITSYFEHVTELDVDVDTGLLKFKYFGVSTQVNRKAAFILENIAGFAMQEG